MVKQSNLWNCRRTKKEWSAEQLCVYVCWGVCVCGGGVVFCKCVGGGGGVEEEEGLGKRKGY